MTTLGFKALFAGVSLPTDSPGSVRSAIAIIDE